jgi:hypothetical protein
LPTLRDLAGIAAVITGVALHREAATRIQSPPATSPEFIEQGPDGRRAAGGGGPVGDAAVRCAVGMKTSGLTPGRYWWRIEAR